MRIFLLSIAICLAACQATAYADEPVEIADGDPYVEAVCVNDAGLVFKAGRFNMGVEFFAVIRGEAPDAAKLAEYEFWDLRTLPRLNSIQLLK